MVRLRTVGFRAFCPACGYLGATKSYHGAKYDARKHRIAVAA
jgi:hypothetical protein